MEVNVDPSAPQQDHLLAADDNGPRVLIVEDDNVSAMVLERLFEREGIAVDRANDGAEALAKHEQRPYRLIISDWMMPGISGVELCRRVRAIGGAYVYFILCSAKGQRDDRTEAFDSGVDDFLSKPLDPAELRSRLVVSTRVLEMETRLERQKHDLEELSESLTATNSNLLVASRRFESLFNSIPVACFTFDENGLVHEWNRTAEDAFRIPSYLAFQNNVETLLGEAWQRERWSRVIGGDHITDNEWSFERSEGDLRHFMGHLFPLRNANGAVVGAISANADITDRVYAQQRIDEQLTTINAYAKQLSDQQAQLLEANARLSHLAVTDGLTGLLNHRSFQEELDQMFHQHRRTGRPLSMILLDVDHFKQFNDTFGHPAGDEVLRTVSRTLKETTRSEELAARYGGEEFAILLPGCDPEKSRTVAERFRSALKAQPWPLRQVTASFGVGTLLPGVTSPAELVQAADEALYAAKHGGRDRVVHRLDLPTELPAAS